MTCKNDCGSQREIVESMIKSAVDTLLESGKVQGTLKSCDGTDLAKGDKVVLCATLADKVSDLIAKGQIDVVKDVSIEDGKLVITKSNSTNVKIPLDFYTDATVDGTTITLTKANGTTTKLKVGAVSAIDVENGKLVITDGTGKTTKVNLNAVSDLEFNAQRNELTWVENGRNKSASLPYVKAVAGDDKLVLTLPDGSTTSVPKSDAVKDVTHGFMRGTNLVLARKDGSEVLVDMATAVGELAKDAFLHDVQYDARSEQMVFIVQDKDGGNRRDIRVPASDFMRISVGDGLIGDGTSNNPLKINGANLAGAGLQYTNGRLDVKTVRLVDASGTVHLANVIASGA